MTPLANVERRVGVIGELGHRGSPRQSSPGPGVQRVEVDQRVERAPQRIALRSDLGRELSEHAADLPLLLPLQVTHFVHQPDRYRGFHEDRRARLGLVVHDAADLALPFPSHGDDVAPLSDRHRAVRDGDALG